MMNYRLIIEYLDGTIKEVECYFFDITSSNLQLLIKKDDIAGTFTESRIIPIASVREISISSKSGQSVRIGSR